ncbi:MAG: hypothetical protein LBL52_03570, partial [Rickettsiales bacterium]|nr:hypothetical protein [Rickettsiales bacterium]
IELPEELKNYIDKGGDYENLSIRIAVFYKELNNSDDYRNNPITVYDKAERLFNDNNCSGFPYIAEVLYDIIIQEDFDCAGVGTGFDSFKELYKESLDIYEISNQWDLYPEKAYAYSASRKGAKNNAADELVKGVGGMSVASQKPFSEPSGLGKLGAGVGGMITSGAAAVGGFASGAAGVLGMVEVDNLFKEIDGCVSAVNAIK